MEYLNAICKTLQKKRLGFTHHFTTCPLVSTHAFLYANIQDHLHLLMGNKNVAPSMMGAPWTTSMLFVKSSKLSIGGWYTIAPPCQPMSTPTFYCVILQNHLHLWLAISNDVSSMPWAPWIVWMLFVGPPKTSSWGWHTPSPPTNPCPPLHGFMSTFKTTCIRCWAF